MTIGSNDTWPVMRWKVRPREWSWLAQGHPGCQRQKQGLPPSSPGLLFLHHEAVCLWNVLWRFWGGVILAPGLSLDLETFTPLCFSQPDPSLLALFRCSSHLLSHPETQKRKEKSVWPMENFTADKTSPSPSLLCSISNLKVSFLWLVICRFSQHWNCPDSQQSCWVAMPQSEFEICHSS